MITVPLEIAKKMKESGWKKETFFRYERWDKWWTKLTRRYGLYWLYAPTVQEILDELPDTINDCILTLNKVNVEKEWEKMYYWAWYINRELKWLHNWKSVAHVWVNASEAIAKLRLRCKENGYLSSNTDE